MFLNWLCVGVCVSESLSSMSVSECTWHWFMTHLTLSTHQPSSICSWYRMPASLPVCQLLLTGCRSISCCCIHQHHHYYVSFFHNFYSKKMAFVFFFCFLFCWCTSFSCSVSFETMNVGLLSSDLCFWVLEYFFCICHRQWLCRLLRINLSCTYIHWKYVCVFGCAIDDCECLCH